MPYLGADLAATGSFSDQSAEHFLRFLEIPSSPATASMVLDNIQIRLPAGATADVALYSGGSTNDSTGMTLIFSGQGANGGGASAVVTVTAGGQSIPASTRIWLAHKGANENITIGTVPDGVMDDIATMAEMWGPSQTPSNMATLGQPWPTVVPPFEGSGGVFALPIMGLNYSVGGGGSTGRGRLIGGKLVGGNLLVRRL